MPQQLILAYLEPVSKNKLQAEVSDDLTVNCYSFVLEVGSVPDCLLSIFEDPSRSPGAVSFISQARIGRDHVSLGAAE
jgi:hypothetical protein